jgi:hypothetical protein
MARGNVKNIPVQALVTVLAADAQEAEKKLFDLLWAQDWIQRVRTTTGISIYHADDKVKPVTKQVTRKQGPADNTA